MNANDIETALRARAAFNDSVENIDADTRHRLRELRLQALNGKPRRARAHWVWSVASALAVLAAVVFVPRMSHAPAGGVPAATTAVTLPVATMATVHPAQTATSNEIVASDPIEAVDPDMLSDIEFYGWLAEQPNTDASGG